MRAHVVQASASASEVKQLQSQMADLRRELLEAKSFQSPASVASTKAEAEKHGKDVSEQESSEPEDNAGEDEEEVCPFAFNV